MSAADDLTREATAVASLRDTLAAFDDEDLLADSIEGETTFLEALDATDAAILADETLIEGLAVVIARLQARKARLETRRKTRRASIAQAMQIAGETKLERPTATYSLRERGEIATVTDEERLPSRFFVQPPPPPPRVDEKALLDALLAGEPIPGAALVTPSPTLTIRRK